MTLEKPKTQFTRAGNIAIAYQVLGNGPVDLIYISGWLHNIDVVWEHPGYRSFLEGLAKRCRVILFDKRGTGMSDRDVGAPTLEERGEDINAVMDAVGSKKAAIFGISEGGAMTAMFAACYPEKVSAIVMIGSRPCRQWKPDWQQGSRRSDFDAWVIEMVERWGDLGYLLESLSPTVCDVPEEREFFNRLLTQSASPSSAAAMSRLNYEIDYRPILPSIQVPALILHPEKDVIVSVEDGRYIADQIPGARFEFVENSDHLPWTGDTQKIIAQITDFVCDPGNKPRENRVLATILMTDIVASTQAAAQMGDDKWHTVIGLHDAAAARAIARFGGTLIKTMGDGILATFAGPSRAVACARALQTDAAQLGLSVRAGIHTGECLRRGDDVTGLAVTIAARIQDHTPGGDVWVSGTVRDLVVGSGLTFEAMGARALKGVPDTWPLFRVQDTLPASLSDHEMQA